MPPPNSATPARCPTRQSWPSPGKANACCCWGCPRITAARLSASRLPCRSAYWAVGGENSPLAAAFGTAALSPRAQIPGIPCTAIKASVRMRSLSWGNANEASTGLVAAPTVTTRVRVGIRSPVPRIASWGVAAVIRAFSLTSTPRCRSLLSAKLASPSPISGRMRSRLCSRMTLILSLVSEG